uniref:CCHC-type domain-containing protein n=1 Tax=Moniliophthora roreri TaxID=221103 RepID=A0A0W0GCT9_MONRR
MADWSLNKLNLETEDGRRRMDPWKLQEVMEQAEMIMSASSEDVYMGLGSFALGAGVPPVNPGVGTAMLSAAMPLSYSFQPPPVLSTMNITQLLKLVSVKQEELFPDILDKTKEEAELRTMGIATSVDAHTVSIKAHETELAALRKGMEDVKTLSTEVKDIKTTLVGMPGQIIAVMAGQTNRPCDGNNNNMVRGKPGQPMIGGGKYLCFYCNEDGHRLRDCPYQREMIQKGWIIWNNGAGKYTLRDGTGFPKVEPGEKLKDRVVEYVKQQEWDRIVHPDAHLFMEVEEEPAVVYQAAVVQTQEGMDLDRLAMLLAEKMKPATDVQSKN